MEPFRFLAAEIVHLIFRGLRTYLATRSARRSEPLPSSVDPENPDSWLSLDVVYDRVLAQLDAQSERWESADGRLRLILGLIGVVFAITSSFVTRAVAASPAAPAASSPSIAELLFLPFFVGAPLIAGTSLYLAAGLLSVCAYWPLRFYRPPEPLDLRNEYLTTDPRVTKLEIIDTILLYWDRNEMALQWKFRAFKVAVVLTTIATGLFGSAVIIQLLVTTRAWS